MATETTARRELLQLEPFIHQVGGRSSMLALDASTICKPLIPQELKFYQTLPQSLKPFTPQFKGIVEVTCSEEQDGFLQLTTYSTNQQQPEKKSKKWCDSSAHDKRLKWQDQHRKKHRIRLGQSGSLEIVSEETQLHSFTDATDDKSNISCPHNPWVLHCHQKSFNKTQSNAASLYTQKFLMLENLTDGFDFPCVLDIKMGTRQYADDATHAKRLSLEAKVAATTSGSLGLRICGMQVYHCNTHRFMCRNKFYGRKLNVEGFKNALYQFFHNGIQLRVDVILALIQRLEDLQNVIKDADTFRFFTSSLLIIYDGRFDPMLQNGNFHFMSEGKMDGTENGNGGSIKLNEEGIDTEIQDMQQQPDDFDTSSDDSNNATVVQTNSDVTRIDVRMIDFAHSTHREMSDAKVTHLGPDEGYLFGLENLISQLKSILSEFKDAI